MIGTHNSLTGYKIKYWLLRPFYFLSKCQNKTLFEQWKFGSRSFDLRFLYHRKKWYGAHGIQIYNITLEQTLNILSSLSKENDPIYFRILCEDSIVKCEANKLYEALKDWFLKNPTSTLRPLYLRSKKTWELVNEWVWFDNFQNYDTTPFMGNDRKNLCERVSLMYELETTDDKINFIGCYESSGIPRLFGMPYPKIAATALTPIVKKRHWKENDCPIVDFI